MPPLQPPVLYNGRGNSFARSSVGVVEQQAWTQTCCVRGISSIFSHSFTAFSPAGAILVNTYPKDVNTPATAIPYHQPPCREPQGHKYSGSLDPHLEVTRLPAHTASQLSQAFDHGKTRGSITN